MSSPEEPIESGLTYPIKAVARLTGLSPDTIRAWERRYGAVAPGRSDGGQRLYDAREVERLTLLRRAVDAGQAIGRIAALPDDALRCLASDPEAMATESGLVDRLFEAIRRFDQAAAEHELRLAAATLSPRRLVYEVALPLMEALGAGWTAGRIGIAQEHLASNLLRGLLGAMLRLADPRPGTPPLLLATPPGELHELGLLCVALVAAARGVPVCYLGPQVPMAELAGAARLTGARAIGLGIVIAEDPRALEASLAELAHLLPASRPLWLGGRGAAGLTLPENARYFPTLEGVEAALDAR